VSLESSSVEKTAGSRSGGSNGDEEESWIVPREEGVTRMLNIGNTEPPG
jgi:hypothetical protein